MKHRSIICSLFMALTVFSNAQDETMVPNELSFYIGPSYGNIKNDNIKTDKYASTRGTLWFNFGLGWCHYFNKNTGVVLGLEYSRSKNITEYKGAYRGETKALDP